MNSSAFENIDNLLATLFTYNDFFKTCYVQLSFLQTQRYNKGIVCDCYQFQPPYDPSILKVYTVQQLRRLYKICLVTNANNFNTNITYQNEVQTEHNLDDADMELLFLYVNSVQFINITSSLQKCLEYLSAIKEFCLPISYKGEFRTLCGREYRNLFYRYKYGGTK